MRVAFFVSIINRICPRVLSGLYNALANNAVQAYAKQMHNHRPGRGRRP
ncbi:hypothetical protein RE6C_05327 [Rhodopirellula europaea 6C]|uniref:Uncharacterized protein n=1 Tax=Rhodopirellula europaea 6C TaxID=1263867 RepID=M2ABA8_9BACT|nr:hypothetical protein RE6C_05327 [Rhodopirellula europaea 6C]